jgi:glycosyltransferase involved in cell wall biosynthesis
VNAIVVIPAFNAAERLPRLLPSVKMYIPDILVVDDGSTDATLTIARQALVTVLQHDHNQGKGAALKTGFGYAMGAEFEAVITIDADGQHDPRHIPAFIGARSMSGADLIIGSRASNRADMPWNRRFSNWTTSHILSWLLHRKIEDSQSGYRLYSRRLLESLCFESDHFDMETEVIIKAVQAGFSLKFSPILVEYGPVFPSHMRHFTDTLRWCRRVLELI